MSIVYAMWLYFGVLMAAGVAGIMYIIYHYPCTCAQHNPSEDEVKDDTTY